MDRMCANIALVGITGVGKSTVARLLARRLGWRCRDTDADVVEAAGQPIASIFANLGEAAFRQMEHEALLKACAGECTVIATGGGIVLREDNRRCLESRCCVVWLEADPGESWKRAATGEARPLLNADDPVVALRGLLAEREPLYALADMRVGTSGRTPDDVAEEIAVRWAQFEA
jgi:shikimate kinase